MALHPSCMSQDVCWIHSDAYLLMSFSEGRYNRQGRKANVGAGTATATEPTREHKQYATQGPTTYLCT